MAYWKRFVLIVQPLQFHYSLDDRAHLSRVPLRLGHLREPTKNAFYTQVPVNARF